MSESTFGRKPKKRYSYDVPDFVKQKLGPGPILNISYAARLMGLSRTEMRRRTEDGIYPCVIDEKTQWRWYSEMALRQILAAQPDGPPMRIMGRPKREATSVSGHRTLASLKPSKATGGHTEANGHATNGQPPWLSKAQSYDGDTAKKVFSELEKNRTVIQIVIDLGMHPEIVKAISASYAGLKGCLLITEEVKLAIENLPLQGELPITDGDHLLRILQKSIGMPIPCARCGNQKARLCIGCASQPVAEV